MVLQLKRQYHPNGTNGKLYADGKLICETIELPWRNNQPRVSCIPEGTYRVRRRFTERFGGHLLVENVTGRTAILIHAFNNALKESKGCIGPVTKIEGEGVGMASRLALSKLLMYLASALDNNEPVFLTIKKETNVHTEKSTKANSKVL